MGTIVTTVLLVLIGVAVCLAWERLRPRALSGRSRAGSVTGTHPVPRSLLAYSFQTSLSFGDAITFLGAAGGERNEARTAELGEWYERDSHWYTQLLSCRSHRGMWMNLYFFEGENVLELKFLASAPSELEAEAFAVNELLPALGAHSVKRTGSVN